MCIFFSFVGDGHGNFRYFDKVIRKDIISGKLKLELDSHTSILEYFKVPADKQDKWSKFEYQPLTKKLTVDSLVDGHDVEQAESWIKALDFGGVVPELKIKPIVHPLKDVPIPSISKTHLKLLMKLASVGDSVRASVGDSVWIYYGSFFKIKYKADISSAIKLWEMGIVPSYDGKTWRLHGGPDAKILWSGTIDDAKKQIGITK